MFEEWKESNTVPIYQKGDKTKGSNYGGISYLLIKYKIFFKHLALNIISLCRETYRESLV
jgi:hypothetical protein